VRSRLGAAAEICFLGDTPSDIDAAKSLQVPILALATGIYDLETLRGHDPDCCLACCDSLFAAEP
jgi:phosphoglycolate phosphatase-like HAD superfamily hydrolase